MEVTNFKGVLYGKLKTQFFVWDSQWELFRPIEKIAWNGNKVVIVDQKFKEDIFSPYYGFGSSEMKKLCRELSDTTEIHVPESDNISWLDSEWWRDRKCTFTTCAPRDTQSWIRYLKYTNSKNRTLRKHLDNRATKRLMPK